MKNSEYRQVRGQFIFMAIIFAGGLVLAGIMMSQRSRFERHMLESYETLNIGPAEVQRAIDQLSGESRSPESEKVIKFYEHWMSRSEGDNNMPRELFQIAPRRITDRVEKTLICGNVAQRGKALEFLRAAHARQSLTMLERVEQWATRRELDELVDEIELTKAALKEKG